MEMVGAMSSDNVARLVRKTCPCGWAPPKNLTVETLGIVAELKVSFDCPECGRRLEMVTRSGR